jgi:cytochrome o ubiquinol oxidase subunit 1
LLAFIPLYLLGLMGMTRRLYQVGPTFAPLLWVAALGACVIALALFLQVVQIVVGIKQRHKNKAGDNPWNGWNLEWHTSSPPPALEERAAHGVIIGAFALLFGFGVVWHLWWLAALSLTAIIMTLILRSFEHDYEGED